MRLSRPPERLTTLWPAVKDCRGDDVSRVSRRPLAEVWPWTLREPPPLIPVPLSSGDADLVLDLNAALMERMERAGYDRYVELGKPGKVVDSREIAYGDTCTNDGSSLLSPPWVFRDSGHRSS